MLKYFERRISEEILLWDGDGLRVGTDPSTWKKVNGKFSY